MSISSSYTHDLSFPQCIYDCNDNLIRQEKYLQTQHSSLREKTQDKGYTSNKENLWCTALMIEPGQVSCTLGVTVDVRERESVLLSAAIGGRNHKDKEKRIKTGNRRLVYLKK